MPSLPPPAELPTTKSKKKRARRPSETPKASTNHSSKNTLSDPSTIHQKQRPANNGTVQSKLPPAKSPPPRTPPDPELMRRIARFQRPAIIFGSLLALAISFRVGFTLTACIREANHYATLDIPLDVSDRWKKSDLAESFDSDVDTMEWMMGLSCLRRQLLTKAHGHILEASAGTGRNAQFFPLTKGIKSVTMVDTSAEMIRIARIKWAQTNAWFTNALFRIQSAAESVPCPVAEGFDTVVQTMGVCSTAEPEKVLRNLGKMCRQDGKGRILLLEHGRGHYAFLNKWIDRIAPAHADRQGCWFNKDIGEIVKNSGLEIVEQRRYHFGTTWWFELKPASKTVVDNDDTDDSEQTTTVPWWRAWAFGGSNATKPSTP